MSKRRIFLYILFKAVTIYVLVSCTSVEDTPITESGTLQERLISAQPGEVILISEGTHNFDRQLSLMDIANVTIRGQGMEKTILSFSEQVEGAEGLFVRANGVTIEGLTVADTKGDGIKVQDSDGVTIRNVRITWTGGPSSENGAYGLYPVGSKNILIEHCEVSGASDAGIYVGQSEEIVVRKNHVFENVAGIEIENSIGADVYENEVVNNTGGILVFDLPNLTIKNGRDIRIYKNMVLANNHPNFSPPGNIVGMVPAGTGVLVMATENVDLFENEIRDHHTVSTAVVSYYITELAFTDEEYDPFASGVYIFNNQITRDEAMPDSSITMGQLLGGLFGSDIPAFIHDGVINPAHLSDDGSIPIEKGICFAGHGDAVAANINAPSGFTDIRTGTDLYDCPLEFLEQRTVF